MIDTAEARMADDFICYCGRPLEVSPAVCCSECHRPPKECNCPELKEAA